MNDLAENWMHASADVICEALTKWCVQSQSEPDHFLMSRAIKLYNRGNDTPDLLIGALKSELIN
ncbi:hypothetical protein [Rhizobium tubonense]|uniref:Uncharacterized protein n=1 Tax=Rhizobium tubonense TaxID=484088 RepID=A0A2W4CT48_9HYPH|nr:hypothetical protein [Rhizobium tubonense]PZM15579.1 hypothetical protein CPY51_07070 [Rhizobium tubonense]